MNEILLMLTGNQERITMTFLLHSYKYFATLITKQKRWQNNLLSEVKTPLKKLTNCVSKNKNNKINFTK